MRKREVHMPGSHRKRLGRAVRFVDRDFIRDAVEHLRIARNLLAGVGARKAADKVRGALKSAEGAQRHIDGLHGRTFPPNHEYWRGYRPRVSVVERLHPTLICSAMPSSEIGVDIGKSLADDENEDAAAQEIEIQRIDGRIFAGIYSTGIVYADRTRERARDYVRLAFLSFDTLELNIQPDCPLELGQQIKEDAARIQARKGEQFQISSAGQTVLLGSRAK